MKSLIAVTASLVLAAIPFAVAEVDCAHDPPSEGIEFAPGQYIYLVTDADSLDPTKIGTWSELNDLDSLQTEDCLEVEGDPGSAWYLADQEDTTLA